MLNIISVPQNKANLSVREKTKVIISRHRYEEVSIYEKTDGHAAYHHLKDELNEY